MRPKAYAFIRVLHGFLISQLMNKSRKPYKTLVKPLLLAFKIAPKTVFILVFLRVFNDFVFQRFHKFQRFQRFQSEGGEAMEGPAIQGMLAPLTFKSLKFWKYWKFWEYLESGELWERWKSLKF